MSDDELTLKPMKPEEAARQAAEYLSVFSGIDFDLGDGTSWHLPNPNYLPRDMRRRYQEYLRFTAKDLDTETETYEHPVTGKKTTAKRGVWPLAFEGKLIDEDELFCIALMSESDDGVAEREAYFAEGALPPTYEKFLKAGGVAGQVQVHWRVMNLQMEERIKRDPKSR